MSHSAQDVSNESKETSNNLVEAIRSGDIVYILNDRQKLAEMAKKSALKYSHGRQDKMAELIITKNMNRKMNKNLVKATLQTASECIAESSKFLMKKHDGVQARAALALRYRQMKLKESIASSQ